MREQSTGSVRRLVALVAWLVALSATLVAFTALGRGPLAAPPLARPPEWNSWASSREPIEAAFALARIGVLALAWYLAGTTALGILARLSRAGRLIATADLITLPALRRLLHGAVGVSLTAATLTALPVAANASPSQVRLSTIATAHPSASGEATGTPAPQRAAMATHTTVVDRSVSINEDPPARASGASHSSGSASSVSSISRPTPSSASASWSASAPASTSASTSSSGAVARARQTSSGTGTSRVTSQSSSLANGSSSSASVSQHLSTTTGPGARTAVPMAAAADLTPGEVPGAGDHASTQGSTAVDAVPATLVSTSSHTAGDTTASFTSATSTPSADHTATMRLLSGDPPSAAPGRDPSSPASTPAHSEPLAVAPQPTASSPSLDPGSQTWVVQPGQHFWSIAEQLLEGAWGRSPSDAELVPYWRTLIEANRSALADRQNPDLIYPGQVFHVPTTPPRPA